MRFRLLAVAALLFSSAIAMTGCALFLDAGPQTSQQRDIDDVRAVVLETSGDLEVTVGATPALTITAGEKVIDRLSSDVEGDTLHLGVSGGPLSFGGEVHYALTLPALDAITVMGSGDAVVDFSASDAPTIEIRGSGDVTATGITADTASISIDGSGDVTASDLDVRQLTVTIDGAGNISASGVAETQTIEIRGSGDYAAKGLSSADARVSIRGAGSVTVHATETLDATIDGSGDIVHTGDPRVTENISGAGDVRAG